MRLSLFEVSHLEDAGQCGGRYDLCGAELLDPVFDLDSRIVV